MSHALSQLTSIAEAAASTARNATPKLVEEKSLQDFVTDMDRSLQHEISAALGKAFPNVPVFGEEGIADDLELPDKAFLIDPLDGTGNWIAGISFSAVSIAYIENGATVLAAVAAIFGGGVYSAEAGKGAWRDGVRLQVPAQPSALIGLSSGVLDAMVGGEKFRLLRRFGKLRNLGSQALQLCAVARGSLALDASLEARLWDDAAGRLIASEAGAIYRAHVGAEDSKRPVVRQNSLCAHPAVFNAAAEILEPLFLSNTNEAN
ncbi:MAG TPA: inositol monophosphatase family protein [Alloacidobacterium sp.]|nr:inositol monophosphatase family protein [Alloacidobacterium sp.]